MQGGTITSGRRCTRAVVGAYWMSSISSLRKTTLPGVTARLRPTSNARSSLIVMRPRCASATRLASPCTRLAPSVDSARFSTSGLVAMKLVGASASTYCFVRNSRRCLSGSGSGASVAARPGIRRAAGSPASAARSRAARATRARRNGDRRAHGWPRRAAVAPEVRPRRPPRSPRTIAPPSAAGYFSLSAASRPTSTGPVGGKGASARLAMLPKHRLAGESGSRLRVPPRPFRADRLPLRGEFARRRDS